MVKQSELDAFKEDYEKKFRQVEERLEESPGLSNCFLLSHTRPDGSTNDVIGSDFEKIVDGMIGMYKRSPTDYEIIYMHRRIGEKYWSDTQEPKIFSYNEFIKQTERVKENMKRMANSPSP